MASMARVYRLDWGVDQATSDEWMTILSPSPSSTVTDIWKV